MSEIYFKNQQIVIFLFLLGGNLSGEIKIFHR